MTDGSELEHALTRVCDAAREHLRVVLAAADEPGDDTDDDPVWAAYVALNNASLTSGASFLVVVTTSRTVAMTRGFRTVVGKTPPPPRLDTQRLR